MSLQDQLIFWPDSASARWNINRVASVDCHVGFWTATTIELTRQCHSLVWSGLTLNVTDVCVSVCRHQTVSANNKKRRRKRMRIHAFIFMRKNESQTLTDYKWSFANLIWRNSRCPWCDSLVDCCTRNRCVLSAPWAQSAATDSR